MDIGRDGRVRIKDKPSLQFDPKVSLESGESKAPKGSVNELIEEIYGPVPTLQVQVLLFDINDWVMRLAGEDPYTYRKAKMLEQTRTMRAEMAIAERRQLLRDRIRELKDYLLALWRAPDVAPEVKRRQLFMLWDECLEAAAMGQSTSNELARAGRTARTVILTFIRKHLPKHSERAYTDAELRDFNSRRQSREPFAPYELASE